jgi:hypothetical protein
VHREEQQVRADEEDPESNLAGPVEQHLPRHLREPVVEAGEDREDRGTEDDVVEVGDHEVRVRDLLVERDRHEHDPRESTHDEHEDEARDEEQRRVEARSACDERHAPREHLDRRRYDDHRRCRGERRRGRTSASPSRTCGALRRRSR